MKISSELRIISKKMGKAIADYDMLQHGDRVLVAVSGGKDSLSLLHLLRLRKAFIPIDIEIKAVHLDNGQPHFPTDRLIRYFEKIDVPYHIEKVDLLQGRDWKDLTCFWCSWVRKKTLFDLADRFGFNKIAVGHHLDDIVETILLNLFYHGEIGAMKPKQEFFGGKLTIIRPLAYESEEMIKRLVKKEGIPSLDKVPCPQNDSSKRMMVKRLLRQLEKENPAIKVNIFRSLQNIKTDYLLDLAGTQGTRPDVP